ncbi:hypothetical protein RJ639_008073, partial [Escallonia herrerae]
MSEKSDHFGIESRWKTLNETYELKENRWLQNVYTIRQKWAKAYLKDTFFDGMTTSGRIPFETYVQCVDIAKTIESEARDFREKRSQD